LILERKGQSDAYGLEVTGRQKMYAGCLKLAKVRSRKKPLSGEIRSGGKKKNRWGGGGKRNVRCTCGLDGVGVNGEEDC